MWKWLSGERIHIQSCKMEDNGLLCMLPNYLLALPPEAPAVGFGFVFAGAQFAYAASSTQEKRNAKSSLNRLLPLLQLWRGHQVHQLHATREPPVQCPSRLRTRTPGRHLLLTANLQIRHSVA